MIYRVYTVAAVAALAAGFAPAAIARRVLHGVPLNLRARLGHLPDGLPPGRRAWLHAVSVGEAIAAAPIVDGLRRLYPGLPLVMTTVTETGARIVRERYAGIATHRFFPLDLPSAVKRAVDAIDPAFLVCMETELWPNVLRELDRRGIPAMIANGRVSDRSFPRYRLARRLLRPVLDDVRVFAMQSDEDARRIIALGASPERVFVTGNIKADAAPDPPGVVDLWRRLLGLSSEQRVWVAGSTHAGEEESVLEAHRAARRRHPELGLILAPRHPERVPGVLDLIRARGFEAVKRSQLPAGQVEGAAIVVLDTVGELAQLYSIADVVFVGGSLVPAGGHNMLEPAIRRKPVLIGPHTENFRDAAALLLEGGGARRVADGAALAREVTQLLDDSALRTKIGESAYAAMAARHGAVRETLELIARLVPPEPRT
jgi:3-deoxy-D-manno-octulosonic-acid transferase